jgi:VWFA-related protein
MRKLALIITSCLVIFNLLADRIQSQTTGQQEKTEAVKIRSTEVLVDAVVVDHRNRLIGDLTAQDFEIYEDGVPQRLDSFRVIRGGLEKPGLIADRKSPKGSDVQPNGESKSPAMQSTLPNLTILLLDYSTTKFENQKLIQKASIKFVEERLQPKDFMAVFILGSGLRLLTDFTNDKPKLIEALKKTDLAGSAMAYDRATLNSNIEAGQSPLMQFQESGIGSTPSGQDATAAAAALASRLQSLGTAIIAQHVASLDVALRSGLDRRQSLGVLSAIRAIAAGVKTIEGRKTLMLFSEGFVVGPSVEDELHSVTALANRSQLAVYCVESQGLETRELRGDLVPRDDLSTTLQNPQDNKIPRGGETGFDRARQAGGDLRESALRYISNATGGFLIHNTNDLSVGLDRIDQEMRSYYLLSYRPKDDRLDGRFRQIRVSVKKPELTVRARSGYYAMPAGYEFLTPGEFQLAEQVRRTDAAAKIPVFLRVAGFQEDNKQYRVPVILEIPSASIRFENNQGRHLAHLVMVGLVRNGAGILLKRFGGPMQVDVTDAEYKVLEPGTVSFVNHIQLSSAGEYSFEVLVKDLLSGTVSNDQQTINLPSPAESPFSLSTILLSKDVDKSASTRDPFLTVQGVKILPSARCQFRNGENLIFYFDIYNAQAGSEGKKSDVSIELSLMREGRLMNARLPSYHLNEDSYPTSHITFSRYLHLAGLPPGSYSLVIDVRDNLGKYSARGQAAFSLVN